MARMTQRQRDQLADIAMARRKKEGKKTYSDADLAAVQAVTKRLAEGLAPRPRLGSDEFWKYFQQTMNKHKAQLTAQLIAHNKAMTQSVARPRMVLLDELAVFGNEGLGHDDILDATAYGMSIRMVSAPIVNNEGVIKVNCIA